MIPLGDISEDATIAFMWSSNTSTGASVTRATDGTVQVYKQGNTTPDTGGVTDTEDYDSLTGLHYCEIDASGAFYVVASDYTVVLSAATIDGQTVNAPLAHFSIENRYTSKLAGATFNGTTDSLEAIRNRGDTAWITATGFSAHNSTHVNTLIRASIGGPTYNTTTDGLEAMTDAGVWDTATGFSVHNSTHVWAVGTRVLTANTNLNLTGAIWDAPIAGHADVGSTGEQLAAAGAAGDPWATAIPGAYGAGTAGKIVGDNVNATISSRSAHNSTHVSDLVRDNIGGATFNTTTDGLEAMTDATVWVTATGFSVHNSTHVWAVGSRVLTGSTNLNDVSAADVNAQCDQALTDYGASTHNATHVSDLVRDNLGGPTFNTTTDGLEAMTDASVWDTATGFSTHNSTHVNTLLRASLGGPTFNTTTDGLEAMTDASVWDTATGFITEINTTTMTTVGANKIADHVIRRTAANARAASGPDAANFRSILGAVSKLTNRFGVSNTTATIYEEDDSTSFATQVATRTANATPVTELNTN